MRTKLLLGLVCALSLGNVGCLKKMLLNGQIASTRVGSGAADTIADYELARSAASAGLLQFEGMHRLAPDNEDALFLLMKGWAGYGYAFPMDDWEAASLAGDDATAEYHQKRAKLAFDRSIAYGLELLGDDAEGFKAATKNADTIKAWLDKQFDDEEDAEPLFWIGSAWLARVNVMKDDPEIVSQLFVGVAFLERSRALKPDYMSWGATSTLAAYHARSPMGELDEAKKLLDEALAKTERKALSINVNYAKYACAKNDRALYEKALDEVLSAEDPEPTLRLQNTIAKRRAKRMISKVAMEECGFSAPEPMAPPPAEPEPSPAESKPAPEADPAPAPKPAPKAASAASGAGTSAAGATAATAGAKPAASAASPAKPAASSASPAKPAVAPSRASTSEIH